MGRSEGRSPAFASLPDVLRWLEQAPASTTLAAPDLLAVLAPFVANPATREVLPAAEPSTASWRERLWVVPPETRLGVREAAEALGRPVSFVYRHTGAKIGDGDRLPHRKLDGELLFVAGELRAWLREHEEIITQGQAVTPLRLAGPRSPRQTTASTPKPSRAANRRTEADLPTAEVRA
jgi:hypothetical protein